MTRHRVRGVDRKGEHMDHINIVLQCVLLIWLFLCSWQDIKRQQISLALILVGFVLLLAISIYQNEISLWERLGGTSLGLVVIGLNKITRGQIGMGDGLILSITGVTLGLYLNSMIVFNSLFIAGFFSIIFLIIKRVNRKTTIPFLPFVFIATIGVVLL